MSNNKLTNYNDPGSFGSKMRARRLAPMISLISKVHERKGAVRILDMGGRETYWSALPEGFLKEKNV